MSHLWLGLMRNTADVVQLEKSDDFDSVLCAYVKGMHACVHAYVPCMHACVHACACACARVCARACVHACAYACARACARACAHSCARACTRMRTHVHATTRLGCCASTCPMDSGLNSDIAPQPQFISNSVQMYSVACVDGFMVVAVRHDWCEGAMPMWTVTASPS